MSIHYRNYCWKRGLPYGTNPAENKEGTTYKVLSDPYHRQVFVEEYWNGTFLRIVYDSRLLNFRKLSPQEQTAWEREVVSEEADTLVTHLRNQDDQLIIIEIMTFQDGLCRKCQLTSPHGVVLSEHRMHYRQLGDSFDGVTLHDSVGKAVMIKEYAFDEEDRSFTDLLSEEWEPAETASLR